MRSGWAAALLVPALAAARPSPGSVTTKDGQRGYLLLKPAATPPLPLVILLHGHGGGARQALTRGPLSVWADISAREGVLVAALEGSVGPDGLRGWNDCRGTASNPATDDVAFAKAVIERLVGEAGADPARVYVMGMSNGAMMTLRLALQLDPPPAAIAAACGLMADAGACDGSPGRAVSAMLIEGTDDPLVPYGGGQVHRGPEQRGAVLSADSTLAFWRRADGLTRAKASESAVPHRDSSDPTRAYKSLWGPPAGPQVELIRIEGGGHAEPTLNHPYGGLYRTFAGRQNHDFESAEEAWEFFKAKRSAGAAERSKR